MNGNRWSSLRQGGDEKESHEGNKLNSSHHDGQGSEVFWEHSETGQFRVTLVCSTIYFKVRRIMNFITLNPFTIFSRLLRKHRLLAGVTLIGMMITVFSIASQTAGAAEVVLFSDDFSTDMGWTGYEAGYWQRGSATAGGGTSNGNPDPASDHTATADNFIVGINIGGDFSTVQNGAHYLTSPVINCSSHTSVRVRFWRWLNAWGASDSDDFVEVYNGSSWVRIYQCEFSYDTSWRQRVYDVSLYAAGNANFQVRIKFEYKSSFSYPYSGWNVDDFEVVSTTDLPNRIIDADFEAGSSSWAVGQTSASGGGTHHHTTASAFVTSGDASTYFYTFNNSPTTIPAGARRSYTQSVDLTGIDQIIFDAKKRNGTHIEQRVLIDGTPVWSNATVGEFLNQVIDVSALSGVHVLELDMNVTVSGSNYASEWVHFDNLRVNTLPSSEVDNWMFM